MKLYESENGNIQAQGECLTETRKKINGSEIKKLEECANKGYRAGKFSPDYPWYNLVFAFVLVYGNVF